MQLEITWIIGGFRILRTQNDLPNAVVSGVHISCDLENFSTTGQVSAEQISFKFHKALGTNSISRCFQSW